MARLQIVDTCIHPFIFGKMSDIQDGPSLFSGSVLGCSNFRIDRFEYKWFFGSNGSVHKSLKYIYNIGGRVPYAADTKATPPE